MHHDGDRTGLPLFAIMDANFFLPGFLAKNGTIPNPEPTGDRSGSPGKDGAGFRIRANLDRLGTEVHGNRFTATKADLQPGLAEGDLDHRDHQPDRRAEYRRTAESTEPLE
jgi:hypothetical protein